MSVAEINSNVASIKWVVFDAVGTVIYPTPGVAEIYHRIGSQFGSTLSFEAVRARFKAAFANASRSEEAGTSEADEMAFWRAIVRETLPDVSDPHGCFRELFDHFGRPEAWACFDDVAPALTELQAQGYRLAVASNFDRRLHRLCDELGDGQPLRRFEQRVISSEVGYRKPAREFFTKMLDQLRASPHEVVLVGDDLTNDVEGARAVGIRAIHLRRGHQVAIPEFEHIDELASLSELPQVL